METEAGTTRMEASDRLSGLARALRNEQSNPGTRAMAVAGIALLAAAFFTQEVSALPCTVNQYNSCYVGVDDNSTPVNLNAPTGPYDFVGIGVRSTEPGLVPNAPYPGSPSGTLNVLAGGALTLNDRPH